VSDGDLGNIESEHLRRLESTGMVSFTATNVEHCSWVTRGDLGNDGLGEGTIESGGKESLSSPNHFGRVTGNAAPALLGEQEIDVALSSYIEAMTLRAEPTSLGRYKLQRGRTDAASPTCCSLLHALQGSEKLS
jgi:hypothetical protein